MPSRDDDETWDHPSIARVGFLYSLTFNCDYQKKTMAIGYRYAQVTMNIIDYSDYKLQLCIFIAIVSEPDISCKFKIVRIIHSKFTSHKLQAVSYSKL